MFTANRNRLRCAVSDLFKWVQAFLNNSSYENWQEHNCQNCKWAVDYGAAFDRGVIFPKTACPIQKAMDEASIGDGTARPWFVHVSGAGTDGICKAKEQK